MQLEVKQNKGKLNKRGGKLKVSMFDVSSEQSAAPTNWTMWSIPQSIKHLWVPPGRSEYSLIGVVFKGMLKEMETEYTVGFPSEGMEWEPSGY